jgi:aminoglycoside phosphotransferase (APT) family kinase protein
MLTPAADIHIDAELVDGLVRDQHPDLAGPLYLVASGWDNVIYRLGDELSVRLPRREIAVQFLVNEQRWLPLLAGMVAVPVPVPVRAGVPSPAFDRPWSITRWMAGRQAVDLPPAQRAPIAVDLARFMADLHRPPPPDAPRNPLRGVPLRDRADAVAERFASGLLPHTDRLRAVWQSALDAPDWDRPPVWIHGDPHPGNFLADGGRRLSAVIDFGDVTAGDPATDLAAGWLVFDADAREAFRAELVRRDAFDEATWARARGWALNMGTALAFASADNPAMASIAEHAMAEVLE